MFNFLATLHLQPAIDRRPRLDFEKVCKQFWPGFRARKVACGHIVVSSWLGFIQIHGAKKGGAWVTPVLGDWMERIGNRCKWAPVRLDLEATCISHRDFGLEVSFLKLLLQKNSPHLAEVRYVTEYAGADAFGRWKNVLACHYWGIAVKYHHHTAGVRSAEKGEDFFFATWDLCKTRLGHSEGHRKPGRATKTVEQIRCTSRSIICNILLHMSVKHFYY